MERKSTHDARTLGTQKRQHPLYSKRSEPLSHPAYPLFPLHILLIPLHIQGPWDDRLVLSAGGLVSRSRSRSRGD